MVGVVQRVNKKLPRLPSHQPLSQSDEDKGRQMQRVQPGETKEPEIGQLHPSTGNSLRVEPEENETGQAEKQIDCHPPLIIEQEEDLIEWLAKFGELATDSPMIEEMLPVPEDHGEGGNSPQRVERKEPFRDRNRSQGIVR